MTCQLTFDIRQPTQKLHPAEKNNKDTEQKNKDFIFLYYVFNTFDGWTHWILGLTP